MKIALYTENLIEEFILRYSKNYLPEVTICKFQNIFAFFNHFYQKKDIDIVILDFKSENKLIFVILNNMATYNSEFCYLNTVFHLNKPFDYQKFSAKLGNAIDILQKKSNEEYFMEKNDSGTFKIFFKDISYIETHTRKTLIHVNNLSIISYKSMKKHETILDKRFFRCHSGYIVNMEYIKSIQYPDIKLITGNVLPLSKDRRKKFFSSYRDFHIENLYKAQ